MGVITHGSTLPDSAQKTDFYALVDNATVNSITDADISSGAAIQDSKLNTISTAGKVNVSALTGTIANANLAQLTQSALVSGAALTLLPNIPSGAGAIPVANIGNILGAWDSKTVGTTYQAATDVFVIIAGNTSTSPCGISFFTDSSSSPTTNRAKFYNNGSAVACQFTLACPVKKNDYYQASIITGTPTLLTYYVIPIGS